MATRIRALGTFRNKAKLPNGIVRRGQTVTVSDSYAEQLVDGGKAEIVEEEPDTSDSDTTEEDAPETNSTEDSGTSAEASSGEGPPETPEASDGAPEQLDNWKNEDLPKGCPKYETLKGEDIHTLGDLKYYDDNDLLGDIKGIGPAYVDRISSFLKDAILEATD